jgi:uncharacterized membrane protein
MDPTLPPATPPREDGSFHTAMAHFYRGEIHRMTTWRVRLDTTSHWAILITSGMIGFTLGSEKLPHFILLFVLAIDTIFMLIEARRYQHLHHSRSRIQLLEQFYFAPLLATKEAPDVHPSLQSEAAGVSWRDQLATDLIKPPPRSASWPPRGSASDVTISCCSTSTRRSG